MPRITLHQGQWLNIAGASLTTSYQGGTAQALEGCDEVDIELIAQFANGTSITSTSFQLQVSDDNSNWEPVAVVLASSGAVVAAAQINAVSNSTQRDRIQIAQAGAATFRNAKYHRIAVKIAGSGGAGDNASSNLNVSFV